MGVWKDLIEPLQPAFARCDLVQIFPYSFGCMRFIMRFVFKMHFLIAVNQPHHCTYQPQKKTTSPSFVLSAVVFTFVHREFNRNDSRTNHVKGYFWGIFRWRSVSLSDTTNQASVSNLPLTRNSMRVSMIFLPIISLQIVSIFFVKMVLQFQLMQKKLLLMIWNSFFYPFAEKETIKVPVLPSTKDASFGLKLQDDDIFGRTYIKELSNTKSLSAAKIFSNVKRSFNKLRGAFITHINGVLVFFTTQSTEQLTLIFDQWKTAKEQGVEQDFYSKSPLFKKRTCKERS